MTRQEMENAIAAQRGERTLRAYAEISGLPFDMAADKFQDGSPLNSVSGLLADLQHFAEREGIDLAACMATADVNYDADRIEPTSV